MLFIFDFASDQTSLFGYGNNNFESFVVEEAARPFWKTLRFNEMKESHWCVIYFIPSVNKIFENNNQKTIFKCVC